MEDFALYVVKKRTGVISRNNLRCLWASSHGIGMYMFVQLICISMYISTDHTDTYQLICTCFSADTYVQLIRVAACNRK